MQSQTSKLEVSSAFQPWHTHTRCQSRPSVSDFNCCLHHIPFGWGWVSGFEHLPRDKQGPPGSCESLHGGQVCFQATKVSCFLLGNPQIARARTHIHSLTQANSHLLPIFSWKGGCCLLDEAKPPETPGLHVCSVCPGGLLHFLSPITLKLQG